MRYFIVVIILVSAIIYSCCSHTTEPNYENPYHIQIALFGENVIQLSWEKDNINGSSFMISKKNGELDWIENYKELNVETTTCLDTIQTGSMVVYSYYLSEISDSIVIGISDTVAWMSENTVPTEFTAEQVKEDSVRLSWYDNSYGEFSYIIDKKVEDNPWIKNHIIFIPDINNGFNNIFQCDDYISNFGSNIYYRVRIKNGISLSDYSECTFQPLIQAPTDLSINIQYNNIDLSWVDNSSKEEGFIIERKVLDSEFEEIASVSSNVSYYRDNDIDLSEVYFYRVRSFNNFCCSDYSNISVGNVEHDNIWVPLDYASIQDAINMNNTNTPIVVLPGTYYENLEIINKNVTIQSFYSIYNNEDFIENTIIDGSKSGSVIYFKNCINGFSNLTGFTVRNGSGTYENITSAGWFYYCGGGIFCYNSNVNLDHMNISENTSGIGGGIAIGIDGICNINNSIISNNYAGGSLGGGGIKCRNAELNILNSEIVDNIGRTDGGGICCYRSKLFMKNSDIVNNESEEYSGGGMLLRIFTDAILENLFIDGNVAHGYGGGICCSQSNLVLVNNIISNNRAHGGGGISLRSIEYLTFRNNIIANNQASYGGGISFEDYGLITNVTLSGNRALVLGGAIYCRSYTHPTLLNSILWNNSPQEIAFDDGKIAQKSITIDIQYSDVQGGADSVSTHYPENVHWLEGNIITNPLFSNEANGEYHLQNNSPCIDAGNPNSEYNDVDGSRNDMGAYGGPNSEL